MSPRLAAYRSEASWLLPLLGVLLATGTVLGGCWGLLTMHHAE